MNIENGINARLEKLSHALEGFNEHFEALRRHADDATDNVKGSAASLGMRMVNTIKRHPIAAVGIGFWVGYVAMRMFRR